eukprot:GGOE01018788.1.p1 GENE.GGOE01018788.1~~GGOE01018788.1.p1  ORF type:complete len:472 (+),score=128.20 GGOE01018788.1:63-1478(+)
MSRAWNALLCVLLLLSGDGADPLNTTHWLVFAARQLRSTIQDMRDRAVFPHVTERRGGASTFVWSTVTSDHWTAGFLPGLLWQMYNWTKEDWWRSRAHEWTMHLRRESKHHDLGMKVFYSFGLGYELTREAEYLQALREACGHLSKRFQPAVGCVNAWGRNLVIIDTLLNVQLFAYTARVVPPAERAEFRRFFDMAVSHTDKTMQELLKPDGSTYHVFQYNPGTGAVTQKDTTPQGFGLAKNRSSVWARGQAWAIYAFPALFRLTGRRRYIDAAVRASDWYIANVPAGLVPYWDFGVPPTLQKYDTSTAACAASGLLELAQYVSPEKSERYHSHAVTTLQALIDRFLADPAESHALLTQAVSVFPAQHSIIYGDYFFVEALLRLHATETQAATVPPSPQSPPLAPLRAVRPVGHHNHHLVPLDDVLRPLETLPIMSDGELTSSALSPERALLLLLPVMCLCCLVARRTSRH